MDIQSILRESQAETLTTVFGFETDVGKERFSKQLHLLSNDKATLQRRQRVILSLRKVCEDSETKERLQTCFHEIASLEKDLHVFLNRSDVEKNSYEQLTFSEWSWAQPLNTIPFVLLILSYFKLYAVPALALLTPVLMFILPYLALRHWYDIPIDSSQYIEMMFGVFGISTGEFWTPKNLVQTMLTLFSIAQSIIQPIQNAIHLQTIHQDLVKRGYAVQRLAHCYQQLCSDMPFSKQIMERHDTLKEMVEWSSDIHRCFAAIWDEPFRLKIALQTIGDIEVLYRLAIHPDLRRVILVRRRKPCLLIQEGVDPFLDADKRVPFSLSWNEQGSHHAILTGPNRGGKSSVLRSTLLSVVMAQTFGLAFHTKKMILRPFDWIATGLKLEDRPGKSSMFEREVEFSVSILERARGNPSSCGLVLFDELFHSTNPPDGARTAEIFLKNIWKIPNVVSFISTHVFHLAKTAPKFVQTLCVPALEQENGALHFTYTLTPGICEVSSVNEILKEKGLISLREIQLPENRAAKKK